MIDHKTRAKKAWPYLVKRARNNGPTYTYKELTDLLGLHHRAAAWFLGEIQDYCNNNDFPAIQALVVNKRTRLPGSGYSGSRNDKKSHDRELKKIYKQKWSLKAPKF